ncbi:BNR repeat domain protein [Labilithrix luteola]|uniref:BNR repeat domain protein n=1 Tax=Labilithrix luteola TaxID=1391654 RepID=A0A0K1Q3K2_9BACT|nr:hypothetical protein [Labilithrix luteola]AKV00426.1 BNR repeat domain protein [Labilithrix luteola]
MLRHTRFGRTSMAVLVAASSAIVNVVACSDSEQRDVFSSEVDAADAAHLPETGTEPTLDGGPADAGPSFDAASEPVTCSVTPCAVELAAGENHVCARMSAGDVRCWGSDDFGSLGRGEPDADTRDVSFGPLTVVELPKSVQITAAYRTTCARGEDGSVKCWGGNDRGQLGLTPLTTDTRAHPQPTVVGLSAPATRIDIGQRSACALLSTGGLACWGANDKMQLGREETGTTLSPGPSKVPGLKVMRTAASNTTTYALTDDDKLAAWGALAAREGSLDPDPLPAVIPTLNRVTDVSVGLTHACAIAEGSVYCWGSSAKYALCTGLPSKETLPAHAALYSDAYPQQISVARNNTCVRLTDGTVQCCGDGSRGQLGAPLADGGGTVALSFTKATSFTGHAVQVVTTAQTTCALLRTGEVDCWGGNQHGELGQGTADDDAHPTPAAVHFQ